MKEKVTKMTTCDNIITKTTKLNLYLLENYLNEEAVCLDATVGNGNDTLFLARNSKFVYGFDIQPKAIETTDNLLKSNGLTNYQLFQTSFTQISQLINEPLDVIVFNFGYLPNGDKAITTKAADSLEALKQCLLLLKVDGLISLTLYWGHEEGKSEREELISYVKQLDNKKYHVSYVSFINQQNCPPEIIWITRKI